MQCKHAAPNVTGRHSVFTGRTKQQQQLYVHCKTRNVQSPSCLGGGTARATSPSTHGHKDVRLKMDPQRAKSGSRTYTDTHDNSAAAAIILTVWSLVRDIKPCVGSFCMRSKWRSHCVGGSEREVSQVSGGSSAIPVDYEQRFSHHRLLNIYNQGLRQRQKSDQ